MQTTTTVHWNKGDIAKQHNQRDEELCKHESHIDLYNVHGDSFHEVLYRCDINDAYEEIFGDAIAEFNAHQKRKDRMKTVTSYMAEIENDTRGKRQTEKVNGKSVVNEDSRQGKQLEYEITAKVGNTEREKDDDGHILYDANGQHIRTECLPRDLQKNILLEYCNTFQEVNPNFRVTNIDLHGDEGFYNKQGQWEYSCIHPHITFIPIATGFKQGLSVQNSMNKALSQMGYGGANGYELWARKEQERLERITLEKYREYCLTHQDFYLEHGALEITHPVHVRGKIGGMEKELYVRQQELAEDFLATEIEQNQRDYAIESVSMMLDDYRERVDDYKIRVDDYKRSINTQKVEIQKQLSERDKQLAERETTIIRKEATIEAQKAEFEAYRDSEAQILQKKQTQLTAFAERASELFCDAQYYVDKAKTLYKALDAETKARYRSSLAKLDESLLPHRSKQKDRQMSR